MHIKFSLAYSSLYGESVYLTGSTPELGWNKEKDALPMQYKGTHWEVEIEVNNSDEFDYSYLICQENGEMRCETLAIRKFRPGEFSEYIVRDEWIELSSVAPFNSSAFRKVLTGKDQGIVL